MIPPIPLDLALFLGALAALVDLVAGLIALGSVVLDVARAVYFAFNDRSTA